jgi:uncharacterized membrane protein YdbT with pleckstrin-like domain
VTRPGEELTRWVYEGIWGVLAGWFRVPRHPPTLPARPGEKVESFRPAPGFLGYLRFHFWIFLVLFDGAIFVLWVLLVASQPAVGILLAPVAFLLAVVPDILAWVAIHLKYDTTWYVLTARSLRIRRGIMVIRETTITFENIQNVSVQQGPLQRYFGIADVRVDTAGGGQAQQGPHGQPGEPLHRGLIEGIADAPRVRDLIMSRLRQSRSAGLGDEETTLEKSAASWAPEHLAALREIRDALRA